MKMKAGGHQTRLHRSCGKSRMMKCNYTLDAMMNQGLYTFSALDAGVTGSCGP
jgi:hypothetical protein